MLTNLKTKMKKASNDIQGRIAVPLLLWLLGVPGIVVFFLWLFFFRGN